MFVSLQSMERNGSSSVGPKSPDAEGSVIPTFSGEFNSLLLTSDGFTALSRVLLVGENDDFNLLADCDSNGPFNQGLLDKCLDKSPTEIRILFRSRGISSLILVWSGVQYRDRLTGRETEAAYRSAIGKMLRDSTLLPIPWAINSSQAELFRVNEQ